MKSSIISIFVAVILSVIISSQMQLSHPKSEASTEVAQALKDAEINNNIQDIDARLQKLEAKDFVDSLKASASFTPSSDGFAIVKSDYGNFLIKLEKIEKYANGYKATFAIGNIMAMSISDIKLTVAWNKDFKTGDNYTEWANNRKTAEVALLDRIPPNSWRSKSVVLSPADEESIQNLHVTLNTESSSVYLLK